MTPRERALRVALKWYCMGECASDAVLCTWHSAIQAQIEGAIADILGGGNVMPIQDVDNGTSWVA